MRRYMILGLVIMFGFNTIVHGQNVIPNSKEINYSKSSSDHTKRILIYYDRAYPGWGYLPWFLYDPLILSNAGIEITKIRGAGYSPDLSADKLSAFDLVIVPYPHTVKQEYVAGLLEYIDRGGSLFLVQPTIDSSLQADAFAKFGIAFQGWANQTSDFSLITDDPSTRILGLSAGTSVYPHRFEPYMKFMVQNCRVLTRVAYSGDPDLFLASNGRVAIVATDIFNDLVANKRGNEKYYDNKRNIGYLFLNTVRQLLGFDFFNQPVQKPQQGWSDLFYGYAAGREFVSLAGDQKPFSDRLSKYQLDSLLKKADQDIRKAADKIVNGKYEEGRKLYDSGIKQLSNSISKMTNVHTYLIRGWHGSILTPKYYGGGLLGFAEPEWQDHLINWMKEQIDWISRTGSKRLIDIYPNDWELLAKYYPKDIQLFRNEIKKGSLEAVNGKFTAAFLNILSGENNIRQFHYGLKGYKDVLNAPVETYINSNDHFDFHPQLPQILKSFGYSNAILHSRLLGIIKPIHADMIEWRGLDNTELETVPQYKGISKYDLTYSHPDVMAKMDDLGYKTILLGEANDAGADEAGEKIPSEKELTLINPIAPVAGTWVTAKEFFEIAPKPEASYYLGVDDLWASNIDLWSSWGCLNESYKWNRHTESKILAAEKFSVISAVMDKISKENLKVIQRKLDGSWKNLLRTQDHMTFGSVDYTNQIPPLTLKPGQEKKGKHAWGYGFELLPPNLPGYDGMEDYTEAGTANYAGPMIPISRFDMVKSFLKASQDLAGEVLNDALKRITVATNSSGMERQIPVIIFNPLGITKTDIVTITREFKKGEVFHFVLNDGKVNIPYQLSSKEKYSDGSLKKIELLFVADIPSLGYKNYYLKPVVKEVNNRNYNSLKVSTSRLENDFYIIEINPRNGGVSRLFDKNTGMEMLAPNRIGNELYSPVNPATASGENQAKITVVESGPLKGSIKIESRIGDAPYECLISLYKDIKRIDFSLNVDYGKAGLNFGVANKFGREDEKRLASGLFVRFPLNFTGTRYINQPFGIYETEKETQVTLDFMDVYQGKYGLALIQNNTPSFRYIDGSLSILLARGRPFVTGKQNYQYSIYTHKLNPYQGDIYNVAKSVNTPFVTYWPEQMGHLEQLHATSFLTIDQPNIFLSALYSEGDTVYARLYERSGKETRVNMGLPFIKETSVKGAEVKLNGAFVRKVEYTNGKMKLNFKPWEIKTIALYDLL